MQTSYQQELGNEIFSALQDDAVNEIMLNHDGSLFVERKNSNMSYLGHIKKEQAEFIVRILSNLIKKDINLNTPIIEGYISEFNARLEALLPPLTSSASFSIRKLFTCNISLSSLIVSEMLTQKTADFLINALVKHNSIIICGSTSSGKTTLLNALLNRVLEINPNERIISIEDTKELNISATNYLSLLANKDNSISDLLKSSLRLRPDRLVIGEIRGSEALDLIDAFATGHKGGMSTLHAGNHQQALRRLSLLISRHPNAPKFIENTICDSLDYLVQIERTPKRHVTSICKIQGFKNNEFIIKNMEI